MLSKKIFFVQPPDAYINLEFSSPPLGLAYLAAVAEEKGWQVKITVASTLFSQLGEEQVLKEAVDFAPDIIAISIPTFSARISYNLIRRLKSTLPCFIIAGGPHATALPEEVIRQSGCEAVIRGEGENTLAQLLEYSGDKNDSLSRIPGISFKDKQGQIIHTGQRPLLTEEELDTLPFPAKHLFAPSQFNPVHLGNIAASRGCPYSCTFCSHSVFGSTFRQRRVKSVFKEMRELEQRHRVNYIWFADDVFTCRQGWVKDLCAEIIASNFRLPWVCSTRVDCVSPDLLKIMKQAGCVCIKYGIESLNPLSLEKIKKKILLDDIKIAVEQTKEAGIEMWLNFMLGFPWETAQDIREQFAFIRRISGWIFGVNNGSLVVPFPSTELYETYKEKYNFKEWWLSGRFSSARLHLYQRLLAYNPAVEKATFPLPEQILRQIRKNHFLFNERQVIDDRLFKKARAEGVASLPAKLLKKLKLSTGRCVKIFLIRFSMLLSAVAPDTELKFLVPLYGYLTRTRRKTKEKKIKPAARPRLA